MSLKCRVADILLMGHNAPVLNENNIQVYSDFAESTVTVNSPYINTNAELFSLVVTYQIHSYSRSCRKYKSENCHYHFRKFSSSFYCEKL